MVTILDFSFKNDYVDKESVIRLCEKEINLWKKKFYIYNSKIFGNEMIELYDNNLNNNIVGTIHGFCGNHKYNNISYDAEPDARIVVDIFDTYYNDINENNSKISVSGIAKNITKDKMEMIKINKFYIQPK